MIQALMEQIDNWKAHKLSEDRLRLLVVKSKMNNLDAATLDRVLKAVDNATNRFAMERAFEHWDDVLERHMQATRRA